MNKKQMSVILSMLMLFNTTVLFSAERKDVSDPVLREIILQLNTKMPRFIDKYGANVFVADEQITRGSLLSALYEYDKKTSSVGIVSKKDFDLLNTRLTALEKNSSLAKTTVPSKATIDIIQVMNDLQPNMPMMLDNSLADSKVFKALRQQVEMGGGAASSDSTVFSKAANIALANLQKDVLKLNSKVDAFELSLASAKTGSSKLTDTQVSASLTNMQKDLTTLSKKVDNFELSLASAKTGSSKVVDTQVSENFINMQKELAALNSKVDNVELSLASAKTGSSKLTDTQVSASLTNMQKELANVNNKINSFETKLILSKDASPSSLTAYDQELNDLKRSMVQMQKSYVNVAKRVDSLEEQPIASASGKSGVSDAQIRDLNSKINSIKETVSDVPTSDYVQTQISKSSRETASDIKRIENRLNSLEKSEKVSSDGSSSSSGTSTVAKISLGITMVAALFIAR